MLSNYTGFGAAASRFKEDRAKSLKLEKEIQEKVESGTNKERQALDKAMKKYQEKLEQVLEKQQGTIKRIERYHQDMAATLEKTFEAFQETVSAIQQDPSLPTDIEKEKRINEIAESITSGLFTREEAEEFKRFASQMVIVIPSERLQMSKLHKPQISDRATKRAQVQYL